MPNESRGKYYRDMLNDLISEVSAETERDRYIIQCCIALSVEALEDWTNNGETPSVRPIEDVAFAKDADPMDLANRLPRHWTEGEQDLFAWGHGEQFAKKVRSVIQAAGGSVTLAEAKEYRERMVQEYPQLWDNRKSRRSDFLTAMPRRNPLDLKSRLVSDWTKGELEAFKEGKEVAFLRALRIATNCSLRDGKDYVERMREQDEEGKKMWERDCH